MTHRAGLFRGVNGTRQSRRIRPSGCLGYLAPSAVRVQPNHWPDRDLRRPLEIQPAASGRGETVLAKEIAERLVVVRSVVVSNQEATALTL